MFLDCSKKPGENSLIRWEHATSMQKHSWLGLKMDLISAMYQCTQLNHGATLTCRVANIPVVRYLCFQKSFHQVHSQTSSVVHIFHLYALSSAASNTELCQLEPIAPRLSWHNSLNPELPADRQHLFTHPSSCRLPLTVLQMVLKQGASHHTPRRALWLPVSMEICPEKSVHLSALKVPQVGSTRRIRCCQRVVITIISVLFDPTYKNFSNFQVHHFPPWDAQATCVRTKFLIWHTK